MAGCRLVIMSIIDGQKCRCLKIIRVISYCVLVAEEEQLQSMGLHNYPYRLSLRVYLPSHSN